MLVTWNPWQELNRLEHAVNHMLESGRAPAAQAPSAKSRESVPTWQPPVDVFEEGARIVLVADLPGVEEKDLELSVEKNVLTVKGSRRLPEFDETGGPVHRRLERAQGNFSRAFTLPQTVDVNRIAAELKNGVLTLSLAKKPEEQPRQIKVSVGS